MRHPHWLTCLALLGFGCAETLPERVREYNEDGVLLFRQGDYPHARETFQAALTLKPSDPNLLYNLGQCYDRMGQFDRSEKAYNDCLALSPNHAECRHALDVSLVRQHKGAEAKQMIEDWVARQPANSSAYVERGWFYSQLGNLDMAQSSYQTAVMLNPDDVRANVALAELLETINRADRSVSLYEHALEVQPNQPEVRQRLTALLASGVGRPKPD